VRFTLDLIVSGSGDTEGDSVGSFSDIGQANCRGNIYLISADESRVDLRMTTTENVDGHCVMEDRARIQLEPNGTVLDYREHDPESGMVATGRLCKCRN
jgi:hypothetical protein